MYTVGTGFSVGISLEPGCFNLSVGDANGNRLFCSEVLSKTDVKVGQESTESSVKPFDSLFEDRGWFFGRSQDKRPLLCLGTGTLPGYPYGFWKGKVGFHEHRPSV